MTFWRKAARFLVTNGSQRACARQPSNYCRLSVVLGALNPFHGTAGAGHVTLGAHQIEYPAAVVATESPGMSGITSQESDLWSGFLWAVPKKRTSHSKKRMRMTHKYLKPIRNYSVCSKCQNLKLLHVLCGHCLKETLKKTAELRRRKMAEQKGQ